MDNLLKNKRILNTRPKEMQQELNAAIQTAGGIAISLPLIEIVPLLSKWEERFHFFKPDITIFISQPSVNYTFLNNSAVRLFNETLVITVGNATASRLSTFLHKNIISPAEQTSEGLLALPQLLNIQDKKIAIFKGKDGRPLVEETLIQRGATILPFIQYERKSTNIDDKLQELWQTDGIDIILITSEQSLNNLINTSLNEDLLYWLKQKSFLVISDRLAILAKNLGIQHVKLCKPDDLITGLKDFH